MSDKKLIIDHIGRVVVGELVQDDSVTLQLRNPVVLHVQPNPQTGQLNVQPFPYIYMEFIDVGSRENNIWTFTKSSIITSEIDLDSKIIAMYNASVAIPKPQEQAAEPEVIKLFED